MITPQNYFRAYSGHRELNEDIYGRAAYLLSRANDLLAECVDRGWIPVINPHTGNLISGQDNGGWRPSDCAIGSAKSSHKLGQGIDVADRDGALDAMIDDAMLERHELYREHPDATAGWVHLTDRAPGSKRRTFWP